LYNKERAQIGARMIIDTCLGLQMGQELLILFDETTREVAHLFVETAVELNVYAAAMYVPVEVQRKLGRGGTLPLTMHSAIRDALGILTCLTDENACLAFRSNVFDVAISAKSKIGHMPGVKMRLLPLAYADYHQIRGDCDLLAAALLRGKQLELITRAADGQEHRLSAEIGGWARPPAVSNGLIGRGAWANLPAAETFIAPLEGTARGSVIVDGSLPGYVIPRGAGICLEFDGGRLVDYRSADPRCVQIIDGLRDFAQSQNDANWCNLAEVGLGVNPAVRLLTGVEVLDEKKYGTAHVALGESEWFGGTVSSVIHNDLIIRRPLVRVDGKTIVGGGRIQAAWADWQQDHRTLEVSEGWRAGFRTVARSATRGERIAGLLRREWVDGRGELRELQVGTPDSARKAAALYNSLPSVGGRLTLDGLFNHHRHMDETEVCQVIRLLEMYELVELS
jgi:hypothetical protein